MSNYLRLPQVAVNETIPIRIVFVKLSLDPITYINSFVPSQGFINPAPHKYLITRLVDGEEDIVSWNANAVHVKFWQMWKPKVVTEASMLPFSLVVLLVASAIAHAKVETSFQGSQYSQYKDYYGSTPGYQYPDLTVKSAGDISNSPILVEPQQQQDSLLSQSTVQQPVAAAPSNQHMYYYETYPMHDTSRRNMYGVPAGSNKRCIYTQNGNMRCYSRQDSKY